MKRIRIGKDLDCRLTVLTNGETVSLEDDSLVLVMVNPDNSKQKVGIEYVEDNVIHFHVSPSVQHTTGVYGFEVWKNVGTGHQSVCDRTRAFELVPLSIMEGGEEDVDFGTDTVDMKTFFCGEIVVIDNLDSYLADAALSANMGRALKEMIESEATTREETCTALQTSIDNEVKAREEADTALQTNIDKKQDKLTEGTHISITDNTIACTLEKVSELTNDSGYITSSALGDYETASDAEAAHKELQTSIDNEAKAREDADTALQTSIDNETKAREDADTALQTNIDNETKARGDADTALQTNIDNETKAREEADTALQANIDKKQDKLTAGTGIDITDNTVSCTLDTNPFVFVDELPTSDIKTGKVYCTPDPESTDEKNIWDEWYWIENEQRWEAMGKYIPKVDLTPYEKIEDAEAAHKELQTNIDNEAKAREEADTALQTNIDNEAKTREDADTALQTNIDNEVKARGDADTTLQTNIDNEAKARGEADTALQTNIDTEVSNRTALIEEAEDETYVAKMVDAEGNMLLGFKESGEIEVPTGVTDDSYTLIDALYRKLKELCLSISETNEELQNNIDNAVNNRTALIEKTDDDTYVMKQVDNGGNLLIGVKSDGEVVMPAGIPDETASVIEALTEKVAEIAEYLNWIK